MVIRITVEVDEERLIEAGMGTTEPEIMAELEALRNGSRLSLQSQEHWVPVRNLRIRPRLGLVPDAGT